MLAKFCNLSGWAFFFFGATLPISQEIHILHQGGMILERISRNLLILGMGNQNFTREGKIT